MPIKQSSSPHRTQHRHLPTPPPPHPHRIQFPFKPHPTSTPNHPLQERKELVAGGFKDKHNAAGNVLLAFGVAIAVEGCVNTWMRTGKLFPGPHLFAGAGIVVLWALAASLVPAMQKGNDSARSAHIALNTLNVALFAWQVRFGRRAQCRALGRRAGSIGWAECWGSGSVGGRD